MEHSHWLDRLAYQIGLGVLGLLAFFALAFGVHFLSKALAWLCRRLFG
jgi:hypothetical protein